jgi:hypothetical protein
MTEQSDYGLVLTSEDATPVIPFLLSASSGITVDAISYTGDLQALRLLDFTPAIEGPEGVITLPGGVFLSSGGTPGVSNTESGFTVSYGTPGDADLDASALAAFSGAQATQDAAVLEFTFSVPAPGSINFDLAFGSDEFPEFSNTQFVDIAAVYVNGVNKALFNGAPDQPLSIIDTNIQLGNFIDNDAGIYGIEYDGFSETFKVSANVQSGLNTIKIAIGDTGDTILDSGLFIANVGLSGKTAEGIFVPVEGSDQNDTIDGSNAPEAFSLGAGDDTVSPGLGSDAIDLGSGKDTVIGTLADLNGDTISNFGDDDILTFTGELFTDENLTIESGSAILKVDTDGDGVPDSITTLLGEYTSAVFSTSQNGDSTSISLIFDALNPEVLTKGLEALYEAVFDRAPDGEGFDFWFGFLSKPKEDGGLSLAEISDFFIKSPEFKETFGDEGENLPTQTIVNIGYQNVLGREPDFAGNEFWSEQINQGNISVAEFFTFLATSEEIQTQKSDESTEVPSETGNPQDGGGDFQNQNTDLQSEPAEPEIVGASSSSSFDDGMM